MEQTRQTPEVTSSAAGNHAVAPPRGRNAGCHTPKATSCLYCRMLSVDALPDASYQRPVRDVIAGNLRAARPAPSLSPRLLSPVNCSFHRRHRSPLPILSMPPPSKTPQPAVGAATQPTHKGKLTTASDQPKWPHRIRRCPRHRSSHKPPPPEPLGLHRRNRRSYRRRPTRA
jgi:hypothetical protein